MIRAEIVVARCSRDGSLFGIRFEDIGRDAWAGTWAFPLKEDTARREGYLTGRIHGAFGLADMYPGCPRCERPSFMMCAGCGRLSCLDGHARSTVCPWCRGYNEISGTTTDVTLSTGGDA